MGPLPDASAQRRAANRARASGRSHARVRARPIIPGTRYKVTRSCLGRQFLLVPSATLNQIIGYWLGVCLQRHGLILHAACFMSNHFHLDLTDPLGNLPAFKTDFNAVLARATNALRGRFDKVWSGDRPCDVRILTDEDTLRSMAYTLANPVDAGLVKWGHRWPGFTTAGHRFGTALEFPRPSVFFDADNDNLPDVATVVIVRPDVHRDRTDDELFAELRQQTRTREVRKQDELRAVSQRFLGERRILRQKWTRSPGAREARFTTTPTLKSRSKWARIAQIQRDRAWEARYAEARGRFLDGENDTQFPWGTYWLHRFVGVVVGPAP